MTAVAQPQDRKPPAKKTPAKRPAKKAAEATTAPSPGDLRAASERVAARGTEGPGPVSGADNDALRAEAAGDVQFTRPDGLPDLVPGLELGRRRRAEFYRALDVIFQKSRKPELAAVTATAGGDETAARDALARVAAGPSGLTITADLLEMAADVEDVLRIVAVDEQAFTAWAMRAPDEALIQALNWYQASEGNPSASPA